MLVHGPFYAKYGTQTTFYVALEDVTNTDAPFVGVAPLTGDIWLSKDGGAPANATNAMTAIGNGVYSWVATATEMQATRLSVSVYDATASEIFKPIFFHIVTKLQVGQLDVDATALSNVSAIVAAGQGTGSGMSLTGGATGHGLLGTGGATSGDGLKGTATAGNGNGLNVIGVGTGYGLKTTGATTALPHNVFDIVESAEPSAALSSLASVMAILQWLKRRFNNKVAVNASTLIVYKDDSSTTLSTQTVSDNGTTDTVGKAS